MIVVRNIFRIKFGQAKPAVAAMKEGRDVMARLGLPNGRLLTDVVGPSYTIVLEIQFKNLSDFEQNAQHLSKPEWRAWYEKFIPYCESGSREIFTVVE
jgi:hypothetical protein